MKRQRCSIRACAIGAIVSLGTVALLSGTAVAATGIYIADIADYPYYEPVKAWIGGPTDPGEGYLLDQRWPEAGWLHFQINLQELGALPPSFTQYFIASMRKPEDEGGGVGHCLLGVAEAGSGVLDMYFARAPMPSSLPPELDPAFEMTSPPDVMELPQFQNVMGYYSTEGLGCFTYPGYPGNDLEFYVQPFPPPFVPVPEPFTMVSGFLAVGGLGAYVRRHMKGAKAA